MGKSPLARSDATSPEQITKPSPAQPDTRTSPKNEAHVEPAKPLAPPPRPGRQQTGSTPDYFSSQAGSLSLEHNPFEQSFGGAPPETPGGTKLPSVAALTSPSSLLPGSGATPFNWGGGSLRTGPLSPAMLSGPAADYFGDSHLRSSFPTPNESSLRTGLTPGGSGSMFPAPSPSSQALFAQLQNGGATPSTLDFHRTAMNAAAVKREQLAKQSNLNPATSGQPSVTSQPQELAASSPVAASAPIPKADAKSTVGPFDQDNSAANSLYLLAQGRNSAKPQAPFGVAPPPPGPAVATQSIVPLPVVAPTGLVQAPAALAPTASSAPVPMPLVAGGRSVQREAMPQNGSSPINGSPPAQNANGSVVSTLGRNSADSPASDASEPSRPRTRTTKCKRNSTSDAAPTLNGRRKAHDTPAKNVPANKRAKISNDMSVEPIQDMDEIDFQSDEDDDDRSKDGQSRQKMTDEEKRKNFLERNRVAALKCRQRKKQWLQNLQNKVELYSTENENLSTQISQLREEIVNLKTLLMAHKDCPVTQQQGLHGAFIQPPIESYAGGQLNAYGMASAVADQPVIEGQVAGRRFS